jgi:hypothetical protein
MENCLDLSSWIRELVRYLSGLQGEDWEIDNYILVGGVLTLLMGEIHVEFEEFCLVDDGITVGEYIRLLEIYFFGPENPPGGGSKRKVSTQRSPTSHVKEICGAGRCSCRNYNEL